VYSRHQLVSIPACMGFWGTKVGFWVTFVELIQDRLCDCTGGSRLGIDFTIPHKDRSVDQRLAIGGLSYPQW
jgi:hypothetical protein